jgi:Tol biopolymer transport system component
MAQRKGRGVSRRSLLQAGGATLAALGAAGASSLAPVEAGSSGESGAKVAPHHPKPKLTEGPVAGQERYVTVVEGTNIAAAVSPDGTTIAFDLYGILWLVGANGGIASRFTDDFADIAQPDWSPDGRTLIFQSYRDGNFHVWSIAADGTGAKQLTSGPYDCREPRFSSDGQRIAFSSDRSGHYAVHVLDIASGEITQVGDSTAQEAEPAWAPDGRTIALIADKSRLDVIDAQGRRRTIVSIAPSPDIFHPAEIHSPSWTPDGQALIYTILQNGMAKIASAEVGVLSGPPVNGADVRVLVENEDVFPLRVSWMPGISGQSVREFVYTSSGKIRRRSLGSAASAVIEFSATVPVVTPKYRKKRRDFDSSLARPVKGIGSPVLSPNGQHVAFRALNDIWTMKIGAKPVPLTRDGFYKCDPAWSPDGQRLVYSSDRGGKLDLWLRDVQTGHDTQLTRLPQAAVSGSWSQDGKLIAFLDQTGSLHSVEVTSGTVQKVFDALWEPGRPTWSPDGRWIAMAAFKPYSARYREGLSEILLIERATGKATYTPALPNRSLGTRGDDGPVWSPDGSSLAFVLGSVLWVAPVDSSGRFTGSPRQITEEVTDAPSWSGDSKTLLYLSNGRLRLVSVDGGAPREVPLTLTWNNARPRPTPRLIVKVGRLWDGTAPDYRRNVDVIIEGNRIASVTPSTSGSPADSKARFIDASGLTLMPGLVDMHTHRQMQGYAYGDRQGRLWLAMGVTCTRSPGAPAYHMVEDREAIDAGLRIGPRHFATGEAIDGSRIFYNFMRPTYDERQLELELSRAEALSYDMIKTYVRMSPERQQKVILWAQERGLHVSSHYHYPALRFGGDCMEHLGATNRLGYSRTVSALGAGYQDVIALFVQSQAARTPTLFTATVLLGEDTSLVNDPRIKTLYPSWEHAKLVDRAKQMAAGDPTPMLSQLERNVAQVKDTLRSGGRVISGTDAPIDFVAVSLHLNLRGMVKYGLTPYEALLTATRFSGEFLEEPLGVVTPGAYADLLLVDGDPLARIEDVAAVRQVIKNGRVFTVDELVGPFASSPGAQVSSGTHAPTSSVSGAAAVLQASKAGQTEGGDTSPFWWHDHEYVESSRAACCADHFVAPALRGRRLV